MYLSMLIALTVNCTSANDKSRTKLLKIIVLKRVFSFFNKIFDDIERMDYTLPCIRNQTDKMEVPHTMENIQSKRLNLELLN